MEKVWYPIIFWFNPKEMKNPIILDQVRTEHIVDEEENIFC